MFLRELAKVIVLPVIGGIALATLAQGLAPNRSEASLRATPFGSFEPESAALTYDHFVPGQAVLPFGVDRSDRAYIDRTFATDDPEAFQRAFIAHARASGALIVYGKAQVRYPPLSQIRTWENTALDLGAYSDGALATFTFSQRSPVVAAGRSWRWRVAFSITDGPCHFLFLDCQPADDH